MSTVSRVSKMSTVSAVYSAVLPPSVMVFSQSGYLRTLYYNFEQSKKVQGGAQVLIWTKDLSKCKSKCTLSGNNSFFVGSD